MSDATVKRRIKELAAQQGSLRALARVLDVDPAYLWRLVAGEKCNPSDELLRKLGLRRVVTYKNTRPTRKGSR